jgi:membrane fusion protein (multidrug efflux system)
MAPLAMAAQRTLQTSRTAGAVAANELDRAYAKMLADSAVVSASRAALHAREAMVGYLRVRAPFDGIITERNVSPGALVGPDGGKPMLVLKDNKKLRLTVY